ncbi:hypothetical protein ERC79_16285 [Rhodococcus sp. ABRD24]|uniref:hypothetical protein n=1 Tax=Rhodococcus sp. ABRD24 TaxID=2507582 RepID=UPI00103DF245|nr:hypothetical protein [Rhodococcus sp. ABRD24]QBJ97321.1 hypothetical protein ERC79_16285 [Rhodococcus sp. ABRD24]
MIRNDGAEGKARDGVWIAALTGLVYFSGWSDGTRIVGRKDPPSPGVQLRFTDSNDVQWKAFATNHPARHAHRVHLRCSSNVPHIDLLVAAINA